LGRAIDDPNRHPEAREPKGENESSRAGADDENRGRGAAEDIILGDRHSPCSPRIVAMARSIRARPAGVFALDR
jgi:hypothetical protein